MTDDSYSRLWKSTAKWYRAWYEITLRQARRWQSKAFTYQGENSKLRAKIDQAERAGIEFVIDERTKEVVAYNRAAEGMAARIAELEYQIKSVRPAQSKKKEVR